MSYSQKRKEHLERYIDKHGYGDHMGGDHNNDGIARKHILKVNKVFDPNRRFDGKIVPGYVMDRDDQYKKIVSYNFLSEEVKPDFYKKEKVHDKAHYFNSSQVLCYNFFRPLMDDQGHPNDKLISLMASRGITITTSAICEFEFNPIFVGKDGRNESSEIDFYIEDKSNGTKVFMEIKYTEDAFGNWTSPKQDNYTNFYEPMIEKCIGLATEIISYNDAFKNDYQLYRNALRVDGPTAYTVFLFPKANIALQKQFDGFKSMIKMENNIQVWYWEDIVSKEQFPLLYEKYFETYPEEISHHRSRR